ncbi:rare lipoprotein A [Geofilum rubicundum JCM 15548]|uniref:Probable endolytic peptidoglycan transglycosylase RlpA n=2 Tax=Geofilum TaxID=1236988 RepID=A0A0E9LRX5_9BACT|nr:rare lipoprotein A [Geofilum rubicundum JCM 15548]
MLIMALAALLWPSKPKEETAEEKVKITNPVIEYGYASYYANFFEGRATSSGELYFHHLPTAAHLTLPLGTKVKVTCLNNNQSVIVTINDRGPYVKGRIIDLSKSAFAAISDLRRGVIFVSVEEIE